MKKLAKILLFFSIMYLSNITKAMEDEPQKISIEVTEAEEADEIAPTIPEPELAEEATEGLDLKPIVIEEEDILAKPEETETIGKIEGETFITVPKEQEKAIIAEPQEEAHILIPEEKEKAIIEEPEEEAQIMIPKEGAAIIEEPAEELHLVTPAIEKEDIEDILEGEYNDDNDNDDKDESEDIDLDDEDIDLDEDDQDETTFLDEQEMLTEEGY